jgi:hypothetical protein
MKFQNLLLSAVTAFLFTATAGGAAMAEGCGDGVLQNETFDGNLVVTDEFSCSIISSDIQGNLRVRDTDNVLLLNNKVGGSVRVIRTDGGFGTANVIANTVFTGDLVVRAYDTANVIENETLAGNIRVNGNTSALVQKNISARNIICRENTKLSAFLNYSIGGNCE